MEIETKKDFPSEIEKKIRRSRNSKDDCYLYNLMEENSTNKHNWITSALDLPQKHTLEIEDIYGNKLTEINNHGIISRSHKVPFSESNGYIFGGDTNISTSGKYCSRNRYKNRYKSIYYINIMRDFDNFKYEKVYTGMKVDKYSISKIQLYIEQLPKEDDCNYITLIARLGKSPVNIIEYHNKISDEWSCINFCSGHDPGEWHPINWAVKNKLWYDITPIGGIVKALEKASIDKSEYEHVLNYVVMPKKMTVGRTYKVEIIYHRIPDAAFRDVWNSVIQEEYKIIEKNSAINDYIEIKVK